MREQLLAVEKVQAIEWRDGALHLLDQRLLPHRQVWLRFDHAAEVADAIRDMVVRGAPAIGIAAAYGLVPVSYTHLDVYKRQRMVRPSSPTSRKRPVARVSTTGITAW